jgi:hypothetical protein
MDPRRHEVATASQYVFDRMEQRRPGQASDLQKNSVDSDAAAG